MIRLRRPCCNSTRRNSANLVQPALPNLHVLIDPPAEGAWNMAVDEALLTDAAESGQATLRFYQWNEPTLSLGYFQRHADRQAHPPSVNCPLVRRPSGGGAIIHDTELTYSLTLPWRTAGTGECLYNLMHETLVEALAGWGLATRRWVTCGASEKAQTRAVAEPFLCFERRAPGDVVVDSAKIAGSAQRRRGQALLQHGSVLLQRSAAAPELPGILEISGRSPGPRELAEAWLAQLAERGVSVDSPTPLADQTHKIAAQFYQKYATDVWNRRR